MGRLNGVVSQRADSYSFYVDWYEDSVDNANNTSVVHATAYIYCSNHSAYASGLGQSLTIDGTNFSDTKSVNLSSGVTVELISGSKTISHNDDGNKTINITAECDLPDGSGWGPGWGSLNQDINLSQIPRYPNFTEHYVQSTSLNSITVHWNADRSIDQVQYSINGGAWINTINLTYTIGGLAPNTQYSIRTRIKSTASQLWKESGYIYGTTKQISIVYGTDFNLGDNESITYTNNGGTIETAIYLTDGTTVICPYRTVTGSSYTFTFTDEEITKLYKAMGNSNSITVRIYNKTTQNGISYLDYSTKICTLTGNVKTARIGNNGVKRAKVFIGKNQSVKRAVIYTCKNGVIMRCI